MNNLDIAMEMTNGRIEQVETRLDQLRESLVNELRQQADRLEESSRRAITRADICWIESFVKQIEESTTELAVLKNQKQMIEFIGKE